MSVLEHDEDAAALAEALAFIDEFSLPPVESDWTHKAAAGVAHDVSNPVKKKRVRDPAADVRRRLKRKEERDALRRQVKDLERQLTKSRRAFQPSSEGSDTTDGDESSTSAQRVTKRTALRWHRALVEEQRKRREAEALNTRLRSLLAAQFSTTHALQQYLKQLAQSNALNVKAVVDLPAPSPALDAGLLPKVLDELQQTVQRLYQEASASWDPSVVGSVTRDYSVRTDPVVGTYNETRASAPLGRGMAAVTDLIRIGFLWTKFPMSSSNPMTGKVTTPKKQSAMELAVDGKVLRLHGIGVLLWSQQADRIVLTYSSLMFHPSGKFCFREGGWLIVQQSSDNPTSECGYQSRSRLASEMLGDATPAPDVETSLALSDVTNALSSKVKVKYENIQHRLLMETGRADLARLLPDNRGLGSRTWSPECRQV